MQRIILSMVLSFIFTNVFSQTTVRFGLEAGPNMTFSYKGTNEAAVNSSSAYSFWGGALMEASLKTPDDIFKLQLEVLYNHQYQKINPKGDYYWMKFNQISMPLTGKVYLSDRVSFNFGPVFNFNVGAHEKINLGDRIKDTSIDRGFLTSVQVGATVGLNYYFRKGFFITGRYNPMFGYAIQSDIQNSNPFRPRLSYAQIGIGFLFHSFSPDVPGSGD